MIDSFLNYLRFEKRFSNHTVISYQNDLSQFEIYLKKNFEEEAQSAQYGMVRSWIVQLSEDKLDPLSINRKIASLRSYYKFLLRQELITKDPMMKIKILKTKKKLPHFVKEADMVTVLDQQAYEDNHEGWRERLVLELLYGTGMRLMEVMRLRVKDIDFERKEILIRDGKGAKDRVTMLPATLVDLLQRHLLRI